MYLSKKEQEYSKLLENLSKDVIAEGIILGMKELYEALMEFLTIKKGKGMPEAINKSELKVFFETYIVESEKGFKQINERRKI